MVSLHQQAGALLPFGNSSSFLSPTPARPVRGDSDLRRLLSQNAGRVEGVGHEGMAAPREVMERAQPFNPKLALFHPLGMRGISDIGEFNVRRLSEGKFTEATIDNMHRGVIQAKTDAKWRQMMEDIRQHYRRQGLVGWKDYLGELRALDHWYRGPHFIDYVRDPHQVEMVVAPALTYMKGVGDCDDTSTLMAASAGALGAAHRFRTYKADPSRPDEWSHVVAQIYVPKQGWVNEDLTLVGMPFGYEPGGFQFKDWPEPRW
jgi:transglutaminase superfamily protein